MIINLLLVSLLAIVKGLNKIRIVQVLQKMEGIEKNIGLKNKLRQRNKTYLENGSGLE